MQMTKFKPYKEECIQNSRKVFYNVDYNCKDNLCFNRDYVQTKRWVKNQDMVVLLVT